MSSTQSFPLTLSTGNITGLATAEDDLSLNVGGDAIRVSGKNVGGNAVLNSTAKASLYPNAYAHPTKCDFVYTSRFSGGLLAYGRIRFRFNGTAVYDENEKNSSNTKHTVSGLTNASILASTRDSSIDLRVFTANGTLSSSYYLNNITITLYFTRYDFSAAGDEGVTSATVSSATGYDGDEITFTAEVQDGYEFVGWYIGTQLVSASQSYTHTVNGSDLQLTAISKRGGYRYMLKKTALTPKFVEFIRKSMGFGQSRRISRLYSRRGSNYAEYEVIDDV